jgi:hypothetical protein
MAETKDKQSEGPAPRKPDFGNAPAEQQRSRDAALVQAEAEKRAEADKKSRSGPSSQEVREGKDKDAPKFKPTKDEPDENPAASAQMTAEYGELDRSFSDGIEVEPDPVSDKEREKQRESARPRATTVKKKEGS